MCVPDSLMLSALLSCLALCRSVGPVVPDSLRLRGGTGIDAPPSSACIKVYSENAQGYDTWFEEAYFPGIIGAEFTSVERAMESFFPERSPLRVLEVGMGTGRFCLHLKKRFPEHEMLGVEPAEGMRKLCLENFKKHNQTVQLLECAAEDLDGCSQQVGEKVDCALFVTVFGFLKDHDKAVRNVHAVLSPTGCVLVAFIDKTTAWGKDYFLMTKEDKFYTDGTCVVHLAEVVEVFQRNGFDLVEDACYQTLMNYNETKLDLDFVEDEEEALKVERGYGDGMWSVLCFRPRS
ncbi:hypothetical protein GUITHDRAFT_99447 [Guillardia theta CCMP2712]|uniref:Methyltransferase domain-containing protein n=1 Tax=Guillardia theta (strain CCMP2712) TaxID=905079 RepID=L1K2K9_GUITC|nr:hypothetical protein GUITHDRAFT_99447 [Guillardia theta CCMP2712]EKX54797.1 hypothetical protein GUITHDRAFT_99447 [Guillardia theta CCMP2712]|eukprot:XP_005841777.1 hypothetical protein GUITHDRAFT_99447 [Guillardia theta CCMP2712]